MQSSDGKNTAALSRDHTIHIDPSGVVTLCGGKWTTYRNMAEDCVTQAAVLARLPGVSGLRGEGTDWSFAVADATAAVAALGAALAADGNALVDLRVRRATLEDVYLGLTRGEEAAA